MRIDIIAVVPDLMNSFFEHSIIKNARQKGLLEVNIIPLRAYGKGNYNQIDDYQYGGHAGMVLMPEPLAECIDDLLKETSYDEIIYLTPDGKTFDQRMANTLSLKGNILFICGHYKGIDQRIRDIYVTLEISVGAPPVYTRPADFRGHLVPDVLTSGHEMKIKEWQSQQAFEQTKRLRPDLFEKWE